MGGHHHHDHAACTPTFEGSAPAYKRALTIAAGINLVMFVIETFAGHAAGSVALQADALDFLGDFITYTGSWLVIGRSLQARTSMALFKGLLLSGMGLYVLAETLYRIFVLGTPSALTMSTIGLLAFAANIASVLLLYRWRNGDANVRSVWLCSRNDAIGNIAVMIAAGLVVWTGTGWPDIAVAAVMAGLFLSSSFQIVRQALRERQHI